MVSQVSNASFKKTLRASAKDDTALLFCASEEEQSALEASTPALDF